LTIHSSEVVIEPLEGVANKWQAHLGRLLWRPRAALLDSLCFQQRRVVRLVDLIRWEVRSIDVRGKAWLERRTDATEAIELNASEKGVDLDLVCSAPTQTVL
jgi:hypothetical protein